MKQLIGSAFFAVIFLGLASTGYAQTYPDRPVRVIVPFPPGSGVDLVTRIVTPKLAESLGQQLVVDNRGGAGGIIGTELAAHAPNDGYHLYMGGAALTVTPLTSKVSYSYRDFAPIARVASVPFVLVVTPALPVKSLAELVALARRQPGSLNYASTGNWTSPHLTMELFKNASGIDATHVPYKGSGPALTDLMGGHVNLFFCNMLSAMPQVTAGKLRALAVSSAQRSAVAPQVPTVAESGYPGFETVTWFGLLAPGGTPGAIIERLRGDTGKVLRRADVQAQLAREGASATFDQGPDDMLNYIKAETDKLGRIIKIIGNHANRN
jgi:tripartite-type tricarboxylate transporter receptor subunit TctC